MRKLQLLTTAIILMVALFAAAQAPEDAYMEPASSDMIELELSINGAVAGRVAVLDGAFIRVTGADRSFAISPLHRWGDEFDIMVLDIIQKTETREALRQLETITGAYTGEAVSSEKAPFSIRIVGVTPGSPPTKRRISCASCCIVCNGWKICACAVSTACGQCCCEDCCSDWPPPAP